MLKLREGKGMEGVTLIQTKQKRVAGEQRNKYKPRTKQEQHLPIRHAGRPADLGYLVKTCQNHLS